jgi:hypothetical protein
MRSLITILLLTLASLANAAQTENVIDVQHDSHRGVTCWIVNGTGISCLPDSSLLQQAAPSSQAGRASKTDFMCEGSALQATPLLQGFQL